MTTRHEQAKTVDSAMQKCQTIIQYFLQYFYLLIYLFILFYLYF